MFPKENIDIIWWLVFLVSGLVAMSYCMIWVINRNKRIQHKDAIDDTVVKAMASKIALDAEKHRKNQEKYNYIKSDNGKE
jgi:hypothetical protein